MLSTEVIVRRVLASPMRRQWIWLLLLSISCGRTATRPPEPADAADVPHVSDAPLDDAFDVASDSLSAADAPPSTLCDGSLLCGDACVDSLTDPHHCGACGRDCTTLHGVAPDAVRCVAGRCDIAGACHNGFVDCDGNPDDGCEARLDSQFHCGTCDVACTDALPICALVDTDAGPSRVCVSGCFQDAPLRCAGSCINPETDVANCGACGHVCVATAHSTAACDRGVCRTTCVDGFHACGADCVDNTSLATCGGLCTPCPAPPVHAIGTCDGAGCGFRCNAGYEPRGLACIAIEPTPRPISPLSTSAVSSHRPMLRWQLAAGTDGAHVEICHDHACTRPIATLDVAGTSVVPTDDLPPGVVFWRLRSRTGGTIATAMSPTWEFTVGARSAPVSTSTGTILDVNGDGYADVAVGDPTVLDGRGRVLIFLGSAAGLATTPTMIIPCPDVPAVGFGDTLASAGDVNGDGFADLMAATGSYAAFHSHVYLYFGDAAGLRTTPAQVLAARSPHGSLFGLQMSSAGDVNQDGFADVLVTEVEDPSVNASAYLFLGGAAGVDSASARALPTPVFTNSVGHPLAGGGDVNGDGYPDLIAGQMSSSWGDMAPGLVHVLYGSAGGFGSSPGVTLASNGHNSFAEPYDSSITCDINGDGYSDVVFAVYTFGDRRNHVYVYWGGAGGIHDLPDVELLNPNDPNDLFGGYVVDAGDVNGDGYEDIAVGSDNLRLLIGYMYVYAGRPTGFTGTPTWTLTGVSGLGGHSYARVAGVGDVNGDGYADLVADILLGYGIEGEVDLYDGSADGVGPLPTARLTSMDIFPDQFGGDVASVRGIGGALRLRRPFATGARSSWLARSPLMARNDRMRGRPQS